MNEKIDNFFNELVKTIKSTSIDKDGLSNLKNIVDEKIKDIEKDISKNPDMKKIYDDLKKEI